MAMSKRNYIIEKLEEDFRNVFMTYADLSSLLPSPTVAYPKRLWEKKMYRARATCRGVHICEETGHRSNLRNFILKEYEAIWNQNAMYRIQLPDPAADTTDSEWIKQALAVLWKCLLEST